MMYEELDLYGENIKTIKMRPWWKFVRENLSMMHKASSVVAALLGTHQLTCSIISCFVLANFVK